MTPRSRYHKNGVRIPVEEPREQEGQQDLETVGSDGGRRRSRPNRAGKTALRIQCRPKRDGEQVEDPQHEVEEDEGPTEVDDWGIRPRKRRANPSSPTKWVKRKTITSRKFIPGPAKTRSSRRGPVDGS
jgi:hypothetical protein